ncbi:Hypothetical predicted protein [Mytilus galloprovincialis]|uniref:Uncharacterized protein n=1 Tax=Mytilus galloprovincialis TaxID=29158 RepID=A0A8B6BW05_MYTGA|nr:Hypothetical predicted protein [Mytilus galloprovincialis]
MMHGHEKAIKVAIRKYKPMLESFLDEAIDNETNIDGSESENSIDDDEEEEEERRRMKTMKAQLYKYENVVLCISFYSHHSMCKDGLLGKVLEKYLLQSS